MTDTEDLQSAKRALVKKFSSRPWFRGAGIVPSKNGPALRLNVSAPEAVKEDELPKSFHGYEVEVVFIERYEKR